MSKLFAVNLYFVCYGSVIMLVKCSPSREFIFADAFTKQCLKCMLYTCNVQQHTALSVTTSFVSLLACYGKKRLCLI